MTTPATHTTRLFCNAIHIHFRKKGGLYDTRTHT